MGEVLRHRGGSGAVCRRPAVAAEPLLGGAGVDLPATRGDRAEAQVRAQDLGCGYSKYIKGLKFFWMA